MGLRRGQVPGQRIPFAEVNRHDATTGGKDCSPLVGPGVAPVKLKVLKEGEFVKTPQSPLAPSGFAVQVGAFENEEKAAELKKLLEKKYPTVMVQAFSSDKTIYRVRIGEPDMETANKIVAELRKHDLKPFVVRVTTED